MWTNTKSIIKIAFCRWLRHHTSNDTWNWRVPLRPSSSSSWHRHYKINIIIIIIIATQTNLYKRKKEKNETNRAKSLNRTIIKLINHRHTHTHKEKERSFNNFGAQISFCRDTILSLKTTKSSLVIIVCVCLR